MHILFFTDNFPPEVNAPASRTYEHCREWVRRGHQVTVITGAPNFPTGRVFDGYRNRLRSRECMDGIEVIRVWTYITANVGFLKRTLDYASYMMSAVPAALAVRNVDVMVATSPQLFTPCAAYLAGLLKQRPFVFELRDLWPESIRAVGAMKNRRVLNALEALELFLYRRASRIVSVTHAFRDNLVGRGIAADKISVTTNGVDLARFGPSPRDEALAASLGLGGKTVLGYVGTHGMAHGLETVLAAAERLRDMPAAANIRFLFLGDGAEKAALKRIAAEKRLDNVVFLDSVPRDEVVRYWSLIDLAIIHLRRTPLFETVIPSKLFECMAMGVPVLHGVAGESAGIVAREGCGVLFEPENPDELTQRILELAGDPARLGQLSRSGREAAARYDRSALAAEMLHTLIDICEPSPVLAGGRGIVHPS
jgi:glycosyltransferase involved in cell wall biosynthesis